MLTKQLFSGFYILLETISKYFRVDRREICFLRYIFEAYDGIASLTTIDSSSGSVVLHISPGCENDVEMLLQELKKEIMIEPAVSKKSVKC